MNLQVKSAKTQQQQKFNFKDFLLCSNINTQLFLLLLKRVTPWWLALLPLVSVLNVKQVHAQSIVPAADGTGTIVTPTNNTINIGGGQLSGDKTNLFQSFTRFGLNAGQIANFLSSPGIQNILGRVVGGDASVINGTIQVSGSNANLFLMNPSGFVFGSTANLNVPGAFTATTANGIGFGSNWFSASGTNNYALLGGYPDSSSFSMSQPGGIINFGNLAVGSGRNLTLVGGTVVNTGTLSAPGGQIIVYAVPGEKLVRLSQAGNPLSLEIQPLSASATQAQPWNLPILSLPQLLTSGGGGNANQLIINSAGKVALSGSGITVENGDVVAGNINTSVTAQNASYISGYGGGAVSLFAPGNIRTDNINTSSPIGNGGQININSSGGAITTGGLTSTGNIQGGAVTLDAAKDIATNIITTGVLANSSDKADVNITSRNGNVNINGLDANGNSIVGKNITINAPGAVNVAGSLNARIDGQEKAGNVTIGNTLVPSSITIGTISTRNLGQSGAGGGDINITTTGGFKATGAFSKIGGLPTTPGEANSLSIASESLSGSSGNININANGGITTASGISSSAGVTGGGITLTSNNGAININGSGLDSSSAAYGGGAISLNANSNIQTADINSSGSTGGNLTLNSGSDITFSSINTQGINGTGGKVNITANGVVRGIDFVPIPAESGIPDNTTILTRGTTAGVVKIQHNGGIDNVPFVVGDAATNGTKGAIDAGATSQITPTTSFPVLPNGGSVNATPNITIVSVNSPPTLTVNPQLNAVQQDKSLTFTYANLNPLIKDADQDNTSLQVVEITAGTLTKNGVVVVPGTASAILTPGDTLEYTPPKGVSGNINGFRVSASDGVSVSAPQTITLNVAPTVITPPDQPKLPPQGQTDTIQQQAPPTVTPPVPIVDANLPPRLDPAIAGIEDKFASQFESYFQSSGVNSQVRDRRRLSLEQIRDILRQIEKETGVKPAIIYVNFIPSGAGGKILQSQQDNDQLELLLVTGNQEPIRKTIATAKRKDVLEIAEELYGTVETPNNENYRQPAQELYQFIVAPLKAELDKKGINNLLFVADEGLRSLPFAALYDGKQFLIENYSVGFTPALSITDTRYVDIRNTQVLAMGASKFEKLNPLPSVPEELSIVSQEIWKGKFFVNQNFTVNNLKSIRQSQPFGIIHLATHGTFEKGEPKNSFIQFWDSQLDGEKMRNLGLDNPAVELLVLSACQTALGDSKAELGFGGIAYNVGVKTAVASLWKVSDAGTLGFMTEFYKNLRTAPIKAEALRKAQLAMLRGEVVLDNGLLRTSVRGINLPAESSDAKLRQDLKHPFYWSAFTMIGNPW